MLAEITAEGWVLIVLAIFGVSGLGGLVTSIITMILSYKSAQRAADRVEAVRVQAQVAAKDVHDVKLDLAADKSDTHTKLNRIIRVQDGQTERLMQRIADVLRVTATRTGRPEDEKMAADADAELKAHVAGMKAQNEADEIDKKGGPG